MAGGAADNPAQNVLAVGIPGGDVLQRLGS